MSLSLCHEIYKNLQDEEESTALIHIYFKALNLLQISIESENFYQQLQTITKKMEEVKKESLNLLNKMISCNNYISKFQTLTDSYSLRALATFKKNLIKPVSSIKIRQIIFVHINFSNKFSK